MFKSGSFFKNVLILFIVSIITVQVSGCRTTKQKDYEQLYEAPELNVNNPEDQLKTKFIFLRLYDPKYNNPLYIANFLKFCISAVELSDLKLSHASIGFSLDDEFYGLTSVGGKRDFKIEVCSDVSNNGYMKKCNQEKSLQSTYAIAVSEEEYEKVKSLVELFLDKDVFAKYISTDNFSIAVFSVKRKFFTNEGEQSFDNVKTPQGYLESHIDFDAKEIDTDFVCSSMVAYILQNSVYEIQDYFLENSVNYKYVGVTDIVKLPGVKKLFSSTWEEYDNAAREFAQNNPEFCNYYKN